MILGIWLVSNQFVFISTMPLKMTSTEIFFHIHGKLRKCANMTIYINIYIRSRNAIFDLE